MKINKNEISKILATINKNQWRYDSANKNFYFIPDEDLKIIKIHDACCNIDYQNSTIYGNIPYETIFSPCVGIKVVLQEDSNYCRGYTIISYPIVKRDPTTGKLWIDVLTDPQNTNGFPATSHNIQALGVQSQVDQLNAEVEEKLLANEDQDSLSSTKITRSIRPS